MGIVANSYVYMEKLLALEAASPCILSQRVEGFLPIAEWEPYLSSHPDQRLAAFLRRGFQYGFRIGFDPAQPAVEPASSCQNHNSVVYNPEVVSTYIAGEVDRGKLALHLDSRAGPPHISPLGIIPKGGQPGKYRLICDLSSPQGGSINDGIDSALCSLHYSTVDDAVALARWLGVGARLAKLDLQSAYRMIPVHSHDQHLLGISWQGQTFYDRALPFGLCSAPIIFTAVADGPAWAMSRNGVQNFIHYLDDFLFVGPPDAPDCARALEVAVPLYSKLGLPVAPAKVEGPATVLTFLGIELDSVCQELRLPQVKLAKLRGVLKEWHGRRYPSKSQLQSLIGQLNHAAVVVKPGRIFLRHLIDTMKIPKQGHHKVRLNARCMADIMWWDTFIEKWNGISFFATPRLGTSVVSDASRSWGCGAFMPSTGEWFQFAWPPSWQGACITVKELFPIVVAAAIWGSRWSKASVLFICDNLAVVQALNSRLVRDSCMMHLLRCLFFFEAHFSFEHVAKHIPGKDNMAADALSRNRLVEFFSLYPGAPRMPALLPVQLVSLLSSYSLDWNDSGWRELFIVTVQAVSH